MRHPAYKTWGYRLRYWLLRKLIKWIVQRQAYGDLFYMLITEHGAWWTEDNVPTMLNGFEGSMKWASIRYLRELQT